MSCLQPPVGSLVPPSQPLPHRRDKHCSGLLPRAFRRLLDPPRDRFSAWHLPFLSVPGSIPWPDRSSYSGRRWNVGTFPGMSNVAQLIDGCAEIPSSANPVLVPQLPSTFPEQSTLPGEHSPRAGQSLPRSLFSPVKESGALTPDDLGHASQPLQTSYLPPAETGMEWLPERIGVHSTSNSKYLNTLTGEQTHLCSQSLGRSPCHCGRSPPLSSEVWVAPWGPGRPPGCRALGSGASRTSDKLVG